MRVYVVPQALKEVKEKIVKEHQQIGRIGNVSSQNDELKQLVDDVVRQKKNRICKYAELLEDSQIMMLCEYVPNNIYQKDCTNIFAVIEYKATEKGLQHIYCDWQNHCENRDVKSFIKRQLEINARFLKALQNMGLSERDILVWINAEDYLGILGEMCTRVDDYTDAKELLKRHGVLFDTMLEKECMRRFILGCSREAYISIPIDNMIGYFDMLYDAEKKEFIINFVRKLTLQELTQYRQIYDKLCNYMNRNPIRQTVLDILETNNLKQKFLQWEKLVALQNSLEDKKRFDFWKEYILNCELYDVKESMYMDFGNIIVTEFKGTAAGPAYFYQKQYFSAHVKGQMMMMSKEKFQAFQWNNWVREPRPDGILDRLEHKGEWEIDFRHELRKYGISKNNL